MTIAETEWAKRQREREEALEVVALARTLTDMLVDVVLPTPATVILAALRDAAGRCDSGGIGS